MMGMALMERLCDHAAIVDAPGREASGNVERISPAHDCPGRRGHSSSRLTVSGEKAGRQTATYWAPPTSGVL